MEVLNLTLILKTEVHKILCSEIMSSLEHLTAELPTINYPVLEPSVGYDHSPVHFSSLRNSSDPMKQFGDPSHNFDSSYSCRTSVDSFTWHPK